MSVFACAELRAAESDALPWHCSAQRSPRPDCSPSSHPTNWMPLAADSKGCYSLFMASQSYCCLKDWVHCPSSNWLLQQPCVKRQVDCYSSDCSKTVSLQVTSELQAGALTQPLMCSRSESYVGLSQPLHLGCCPICDPVFVLWRGQRGPLVAKLSPLTLTSWRSQGAACSFTRAETRMTVISVAAKVQLFLS